MQSNANGLTTTPLNQAAQIEEDMDGQEEACLRGSAASLGLRLNTRLRVQNAERTRAQERI